MVTLQEAAEMFVSVDRSAATNRNYKQCLNALAAGIGEERPIGEITYADLLRYTVALKPRISPSTFAQYVTIIKVFFGWGVDVKLILDSPAGALKARRPPKDPAIERAMPPEHLQAMLDVAYAKPRNYAILMFFADTGARVGGVASLRLSKLDLEANEAVIIAKGGRPYKVYFCEPTASALQRWLAVRPQTEHDYVFTASGEHQPLTKSSITDMIRSLSTNTMGIAYGPHSIRHAVGHALAKAGVPVTVTQQKLGHQNPENTLIYYPTDAHLVREMGNKHSLVTGAAEQRPNKDSKTSKIITVNQWRQNA